MSEFFCKTRLFWAISRFLMAIVIFFETFTKFKEGYANFVNLLILIYGVSLLIIAINEFREKETNAFFLLFIGISSMLLAVFLVSLTIGSLKAGFGIWLFLIFAWMVIIGLKDILGNHFYIEE